MKIGVFSTQDIHGGAAKASQRLCEGLITWGIDVDYLVKYKRSKLSYAKQISYEYNSDLLGHAVQSEYIRPNRTECSNTYFSFSYSNASIESILDRYDLINLHWIETFLSQKNLYEIVQCHKPIVWTLHDMKPFTGGCHYNAGCMGFQSECYSCIQLKDDPHKLPSIILQMKRKILAEANLTVVAPSRWLANEAKKSSLFKNFDIHVIPNGIDSNLFKPYDKSFMKKKFGFNKNDIVLMFGAMNHNDKRKGYKELILALEKLIVPDTKIIKALFVGEKADKNFPIPTVSLGFIATDQEMAEVYSAADIFIIPSLEDNFPNTILEAFSCAIPIIGFDTGGISDIVDETNGIVVPKGNIDALANAMSELIHQPEKIKILGENGREKILNQYQLGHQAEAYRLLFSEIIANTHNYNEILQWYDDTKLDGIVGYSLKSSQIIFKQSNDFPKQIRAFYTFFKNLLSNNEKYIIYGNGSIGKMIASILGENIVGFIDQISLSNSYSRENLLTFNELKLVNYDKIIISVFGEERQIEQYLLLHLDIESDKIIKFQHSL